MLEAYIAGLNPLTSTSRFAVTGVSLSDATILSWPSASGRLYTVYFSTNLMSGFTAVASNLPWMPPVWTDSVHQAAECGFYRIKVTTE